MLPIHAHMYHFCRSMTTGSSKCIHLTKTESQLIYTALQSSDINEIARALSEQQVTIGTIMKLQCLVTYTHPQVMVYSILKQHWKTFLHQDYESLKE